MTRCLVGVVVGVAAIAACGRAAPVTEEMRARDAFVRRLAGREGMTDVWSLMSRSTIAFEDGLTPIQLVDPAIPFAGWRELPAITTSGVGQPVRWMGPRAHLRLRGDGAMRLEIDGRVDLHQLFARPLITASLDGVEFHAALPDDGGYFTITAELDASRVATWADLYLSISTVHEPWRALTTLKVARLERVIWEPAAARPGR